MNAPPSVAVVTEDRRPLKTRSWRIFQILAARLAASGVTPNMISVASVCFAALGAIGFLITTYADGDWLQRAGWIIAASGIQLRLIANLLDGMVAVEGGKGSATGPLYNEVPDRLSDPILLIAAGYAATGEATAGWAAASAALLVAYIRAIAASVGCGQLFHGPMAKQQRMALLTGTAVALALLPNDWSTLHPIGFDLGIMQAVLWLIAFGSLVTVARRLRLAAHLLQQRANAP